ncbi:DNA-directed RNA polymerase subunit [Puccinia sorghi]|uniref:DNA-directed RNA polymerase subunit n=1 Tax=Puccinia sorghi TaxID=27349 RepID=A0A0L6VS66_9BASI|nr:DNA-directed RNA polymerase subunit [Puccinia sorghi]
MSSLRFCRDCANLLYPRADKVHKVLTFACRNCVYFEEAAQTEEERGEKWLVYRNDLMAESKETAGVTQDLHTDPTLVKKNESFCLSPRLSHDFFEKNPQLTPATHLSRDVFNWFSQDQELPVLIVNTGKLYFCEWTGALFSRTSRSGTSQVRIFPSTMSLFYVCTSCNRPFQVILSQAFT